MAAGTTAMDKPMSNFVFWFMTVVFDIRDRLRPRERILAEVDLFPGAHVLDYGSGPGTYSLLAARRVGRQGKVIALDLHAKAGPLVLRRAAQRGLDNIETIRAANPGAIPGETIDVVLLYDVFHLLADQQGVLRGLHRVLKAGGVLSFSDHHMKQPAIIAGVTGAGLFELVQRGRYTYRFVKSAPPPHATADNKEPH
jgi:ubiquinone/menaquinone biosynthesis C-methylase UbiE